MTTTTEQIEARALELHNTRNANATRHGWIPQKFEGRERAFCLSEAAHRLSEEARLAEEAAAEIAYWSRASTPALKAMISALEAQRKNLNYVAVTPFVTMDRDADELRRMRFEYTRRLQIKIAADDAATDAALAESAARLADMRGTPAPVHLQAAE